VALFSPVLGGVSTQAITTAHAAADRHALPQQEAPVVTSHLVASMEALCITADGVWAAGGSGDGRVCIWNTVSGALVRCWEAHYKAVTSLAWSPCGSVLVSGGADGLVHVWDAPTALATADGFHAAAAFTGMLPLATTAAHSLPVHALAFSPHSAAYAAVLVTGSADGTVRCFRLARREATASGGGGGGGGDAGTTPAALLPAGVWDVSSPVHAVAVWAAVGVSPLSIAAGLTDGTVAVAADALRVAAERRVGREGGGVVELRGHVGPVVALTVCPDGATVVSGGHDGVVRVWDLPSAKQVNAFTDHRAPITNVAVIVVPPGVALQGRGAGRHRTDGGATTPHAPKPGTLPAPAVWRKHPYRVAPGVPPPADVLLVHRAYGDAEPWQQRRATAAAGAALLASMVAAGAGATPPAPAPASMAVSATTDVVTTSVATPPPSEHAPPAAEPRATESLSAEVAALQAKLAALEGENARWKDVSNKLMARLQAGGGGSGGGGAVPSVGDKRGREE